MQNIARKYTCIEDLPFSPSRKNIYEFYKLTFNERGCPMKVMAHGNEFHPILAPYLIVDFVSLYESTGNEKYIEDAVYILETVIPYAQHDSDTIRFIYKPESGLSYVPKEFYSALTQARYIQALCSLSKYKGDIYKDRVIKIFNSLLVPISSGGVLISTNYGWIVEEYPHNPPLYTLNGWLTVLRIIGKCRSQLEVFGIDFSQFLNNNFDAVEHLLPLYDFPSGSNSRYQLAGFTRLRFIFDKPVGQECLHFKIETPGHDPSLGKLEKTTSRWDNYVERNEGRLLQFNIVLSLIGKPQANVFNAKIKISEACAVRVQVSKGDYRPDLSAMPAERWEDLDRVNLSTAGEHDVEFLIPYDDTDMFAYPTNFKKKINGLNYNVYHFVHILDLAHMFQLSKRLIFKEYALLWLSYVSDWTSARCLDGYEKHQLEYGDKFYKKVYDLLGHDEK